ncbi:unnamed protein product, partial [Ectocarpus sp. 12 AP-2014]
LVRGVCCTELLITARLALPRGSSGDTTFTELTNTQHAPKPELWYDNSRTRRFNSVWRRRQGYCCYIDAALLVLDQPPQCGAIQHQKLIMLSCGAAVEVNSLQLQPRGASKQSTLLPATTRTR